MPQTVYFLVLRFHATVERFSRYMHLTRSELASAAYDCLALRAVASSGHCAAVHQSAVLLLMIEGRRGAVYHEIVSTRVHRREDRALGRIASLTAGADTLTRVRELVRLHEVLMAVVPSIQMQFPRLRGAVDRLLALALRQYEEDVDSTDSDGSDDV